MHVYGVGHTGAISKCLMFISYHIFLLQTISIPGSKEDRKFLFKTAQGDLDGQGSLECVHQAVDTVKQPRVSTGGIMGGRILYLFSNHS